MIHGDTSLKGKLLVAMPDMGDPRFSKSVIFMCSHDDEGAMGIVINQKIDEFEGQSLLDQLGIMSMPGFDLEICHGGPVDKSRGFLLHSEEYVQTDTVPIVEGISVTGTIAALKAAAQGKGPNQMIFALGYAGWTSGQLDQEIQQNAWLVSDADPQLVFSTPKDKLWVEALKKMGVDPLMLAGAAGHA